MSWVRIEDTFPDHPKAARAGLAGVGLYIAGLCYCARLLTDGHIPEPIVSKLTGLPRHQTRDLVDRLVKAGLWDLADGGYQVHDYLDYQPTRAQVVASRAETHDAKVRAGRSGAAKRWQTDSKLQSKLIADPIADPIAEQWQPANSTAIANDSPIPSHPDQGSSNELPKQKRARRRDLTEADLAEFRDRFPTLDVGREAERYENWCQAKGQPHKDKVAGLRNWLMEGEDRAKTRQTPRPANGVYRGGPSPADRADARLRGV